MKFLETEEQLNDLKESLRALSVEKLRQLIVDAGERKGREFRNWVDNNRTWIGKLLKKWGIENEHTNGENPFGKTKFGEWHDIANTLMNVANEILEEKEGSF